MKKDKEYYRMLSMSGILNESYSNISRCVFFDLDSTIIDSPTPETHKEIYKEKTGQDWPHVGWWSKHESLDQNIFDIKIFDNVVRQINIDNKQSDTLTALLTARMSKMKDVIVSILNSNNIKLDDVLLKNDNREKDQRIVDYIKLFPNLKVIDVYDDREKEFALFIPLREKLSTDGIEMNIFKVDNGNISRL